MRFAQHFHEGFKTLGDLSGRHVRKAIQYVHRRIEFGKKGRHFGLHSAVPRESQIDDWEIESPLENRRMHHSGARGATSLRDRRSVEHDWLAIAGTVWIG